MTKQASSTKAKGIVRLVVMVLTPSGRRTMRTDTDGVNERVFGR